MRNLLETPAQKLLGSAAIILMFVVFIVFIAISQPYSGLKMKLSNEQIILTDSQHSYVPPRSQLMSIGVLPNNSHQILLSKNDFIEDPHFLPSYTDMQNLFAC